MLARAYNTIKQNEGKLSDKDILAIRHFYIDVDPVRPAGTSATDDQHTEALKLISQIKDDLLSAGWPIPSIVGDTGNGGNLIFKVDLPADEKTKALYKRCLESLAHKYDTENQNIDRSVHDPSRITRVLGTFNRKGDEVPESRN